MNINTAPINILECVDSTNNYAMEQVHAGNAANGDAWFALEQTAGKGRRGKHWNANKGENIILSVVISTEFLPLYQQFKLSAAISLACWDMLSKYAGNNLKIKWPNDLFWNDRKAGGILIENIINGDDWRYAIIGIGININQTKFDFDNSRAVSLKQITGEQYHPVNLSKELYHHILKRVHELRPGDFKNMLIEYNSLLFKKNEKVKLKRQNVIFETTIIGVSSLGQLQTVDSIEHTFNFDEIEWLL
jgi:BirA family biotin operon repressor/biotin-[acetyl-CoA-carboxylase] ligase